MPYKDKNKEREYNKIYYQEQKEKRKNDSVYKEKIRENYNRYRKRHPDRIKANKQKYRQSEKGKATEKIYQETHREIHRGYVKKYIKKNPDKKKEWARNSYYRNRDKILPKQRIRGHERVLKLKEICMKHYCNGELKCQICGISDIEVLTMDHINGGGNRLRKEFGEKSGAHLYSKLIKNNFPEGYRVLCFNCNHKESLRLKLRGKKASDNIINQYLERI